MQTIDSLKDLFVIDPSEALYRAEEELSYGEFIEFVMWTNVNEADEWADAPAEAPPVESIATANPVETRMVQEMIIHVSTGGRISDPEWRAMSYFAALVIAGRDDHQATHRVIAHLEDMVTDYVTGEPGEIGHPCEIAAWLIADNRNA